jgi:hypothetical protein
MTDKTEGAIAITASLFVLSSAMIDSVASLFIAFLALLGLGVYHLTKQKHHDA